MGRKSRAQLEAEALEAAQAIEEAIPAEEEEKKEEPKIESPQSAQRRTASKQRAQAKEGAKKLKEYYECRDDKVVKVVEKANGGKYRTFILNRKKNKESYEHLVADLKKKGQEIKNL